MIESIFRDLLLSAEGNAITAKLATYNFGDAAVKAAIFTGDIPDDAAYPAILITAVGGRDWGTRDRSGGELQIDLQVFDDKATSHKMISELAWAIRDLVHRHNMATWLAPLGWEEVGCIAEPPQSTSDGFGFPGYTIRVSLRIIKSAA